MKYDALHGPISHTHETGMTSKFNAGNLALLVVVVVVTVLIVWLSVSYSDFNSEWYQNLTKPPGLAPAHVFGIVWTVLYIAILIGVIYAILVSTSLDVKVKSVILYILALLLTLMWIVSFSELQQPPVALAIILLTLAVVGVLIWQLMPSKLRANGSSWDVIPSFSFILLFIWLLVATYYNLAIVALNPAGGSACKS